MIIYDHIGIYMHILHTCACIVRKGETIKWRQEDFMHRYVLSLSIKEEY